MTTQITIVPKVLNVTIRAPYIGITTSGPAGPAGQSITLADPANGLTLSGYVLGITIASATSYGALSPTDWSTFAGKISQSQADARYLRLDQTSPQVTVGGFSFPSVSISNTLKMGNAPTVPTSPALGELWWNDADQCLSYGVANGSLEIGQETCLNFVNLEDDDLVDGEIVSVVGVSGNRIAVKRTDATSATSARACVGMVTNGAAKNQIVRVTMLGSVHKINTGSLVEGIACYVDPAHPGKITQVQPNAPNYTIALGVVSVSHAVNGVFTVRVLWIPSFTDLSDVNGTPLTVSGQIAVWDQTSKVFDFSKNINDYQGKITLSGLLFGDGSIVEVAPTGTSRLVDVIFDQTLTAYDLPTYAATADAGTDVVTFATHTPTNKETYYIVGGTPPTFSDGVNRSYVNEFIGPVVYAVSSSGNTCKLSATSGGAPLDITNAGSGWSLRAAGLASITLTGLTASSHVELEVLHPNGAGWLTTGAGNSMSVGMNGDDATNYATGTTESKGFTIGFEGNTFYRSFCRIDSYPGFAAGITYSSARYGTDATIANSTPYTTGPSMTSYVSPGFNGATSMRVFDSTGAYNVKIGARFIVRKIG